MDRAPLAFRVAKEAVDGAKLTAAKIFTLRSEGVFLSTLLDETLNAAEKKKRINAQRTKLGSEGRRLGHDLSAMLQPQLVRLCDVVVLHS